MVFSSFTFIFLFLPIFLACYHLAPTRFKNLICLVASLLFYAWGAPAVVLILTASSFVDYIISHKLTGDKAKRNLAIGIVINVSLLFYYKYANFFVAQSDFILAQLGFDSIPWVKVILPAGISFFTFEKISYLVDVYQNKAKASKKFTDYLLFVSLFPHLIAGPILKYHDLSEQIQSRTCTADDFFRGWTRFILGLAKKVLIADELGKIANNLFEINPLDLSLPFAWLAVIAYSLQIYFDFSGYSDMAIGLARMMGFKFLENFNAPYISQSITDFWRRWHISLGNWMKEYLYIPLGGNRNGIARNYFNLVLVFSISGIWHGASWTFLCWGLFHGLFLVLDRIAWLKFSAKLPKFFNIILTYIIVLIGWVMFRAETFQDAAGVITQMFSFNNFAFKLPNNFNAEIIHSRGIFILITALFFAFIPAFEGLMTFTKNIFAKIPVILQDLFISSLTLIGLILSVLALAEGNFSPFLYFQF